MSSKKPLKSIDSSLSAYNFEENDNNFLSWGKKFTKINADKTLRKLPIPVRSLIKGKN